jgi:tRNA(Ile)-lysidine synthase
VSGLGPAGLAALVERSLAVHRLFDGATRILVGCSGGPDSQALLHVLWSLRGRHGRGLVAASVHHGLRADADRDVAVAGELAAHLGLPFHALRVHVPQGPSLQAQARAVRYAALFDTARAVGAELVAVAHTRDDQAETVLARLVRGTSVLGLEGIERRRADGLVRPLLDATRADVLAYLSAAGLTAVHDPSNENPRFLRVRVRRRLLPLLGHENPRVSEALAALADDAAGAAEVLTAHADAHIAACEGRVEALRGAGPYLRRLVLARWCEHLTGVRPTRRQLVQLAQLVDGPGEVRIAGDRCLLVDESGRLVVGVASKRGRGRGRHTMAKDPDTEPA